MDPDLRIWSAQRVSETDVAGCAVGGLSVGEPKPVMAEMLELSTPLLPRNKPRYLMGVGSPEDLWHGVARGIDMFDCVLPTRLGRHGAVLTPAGQVDLRKVVHARRNEPIDSTCDCPTCTQFTVDYLHHLLRAEEDLGRTLMSIHNIRYLTRLAQDARLAILEGRFAEFRTARGST
jgi:queuine tRNA-ribosyltransferase